MHVPNVTMRGNVYQYYRRVPKSLVDRYGSKFVRLSLRTSDPHIAAKMVVQLNKKYDAEFKVLDSNTTLTPEEVTLAGKSLAEQYTLETFVDYVVSPAEEKFAVNQEHYDLIERRPEPNEYLKPHQLQALKILQNPDRFSLSEALHVYFQSHPKGNQPVFITKVTRDWNTLTALFGNIDFLSLSRQHARAVVDHLSGKGLLTSTVRRMANTIRAVVQSAIIERELTKINPFANLRIQGEGRDSKPKSVPTVSVIEQIIAEMQTHMDSAVPLMIILQAELGTRIGEISGLSIDDAFVAADIPHVHFREHPWRTLKSDESERRVPLVGVALDAMIAALSLPRAGKGLFENYAKSRGNDMASAAANKRLRKWGITTHSFRHAMKDRLREVGCPKDIRDAIQGHANGDIADSYGQGHTLQTMKTWLEKVMVRVDK